MAKLRVQGSRWWAFDGTELIQLTSLKTFDQGSDSAGKIETTTLDSEETKTYIPGLSNPGDGSLGFDIDTSNPSHLKIVQWATEKKALTIIQGGTDSQAVPTVTGGVLSPLPAGRTWWQFDASFTTPVWKFDADTLVNCTVTMQRSSKTTFTPATP